MKIAIICPNYPPACFEGGIAHYSRLLANYLKLRGHQVVAITSTEYSYPVANGKESEGVETIFVKGPWNQYTIRAFKKIVLNRKIDVLVLQYSPASFQQSFRLKWAVSNFGCPKITAFHTLWGAGFDRIIGILNLIGCKKIIATNSEIMTILERRLSFLLKKTYWIPIASNINPDYSNVCKQEEERHIITYFGMLYPGKGLDLILDALESLRSKNRNFDFKFIGGGMLNHEYYEKTFRAKIKKRNLNGKVEHLGLISENEVSKWLNKSRFVFLPYERGLSDRRGSFMAAIAHGKAVLTSPPYVRMPFLKNGYNVLWPEKRYLKHYIELMELLLNDDETADILGKRALELSKYFKWETIAKEYEMVMINQ